MRCGRLQRHEAASGNCPSLLVAAFMTAFGYFLPSTAVSDHDRITSNSRQGHIWR
jgi:hypothetical protein